MVSMVGPPVKTQYPETASVELLVNVTLRGWQPAFGLASKSETGFGFTFTETKAVSGQPIPALSAINLTKNVLAVSLVFVKILLTLDPVAVLPAPKFQAYELAFTEAAPENETDSGLQPTESEAIIPAVTFGLTFTTEKVLSAQP